MLLFMLAAVLPLCISGQLTTPEEDAAILFMEVDRNGDKVVQLSELIFYFDQMDADQDGGISRHEFALYWEAEYPEIPSQAIHALFDLFDFNADHHLVLTDLTNFYPVMNTDDDIAVTEQEFLVYWTAASVGILVFFCFSLTESEIPRTWHSRWEITHLADENLLLRADDIIIIFPCVNLL